VDALSDVVERWRSFEVIRSTAESLGIVPGRGKQPAVAHSAKKAPDKPCLVAVVYREPLPASATTDGTLPALSLKQLVVLAGLKAVYVLHAVLV
jgi:hypothetical protein